MLFISFISKENIAFVHIPIQIRQIFIFEQREAGKTRICSAVLSQPAVCYKIICKSTRWQICVGK